MSLIERDPNPEYSTLDRRDGLSSHTSPAGFHTAEADRTTLVPAGEARHRGRIVATVVILLVLVLGGLRAFGLLPDSMVLLLAALAVFLPLTVWLSSRRT